MTFEHLFMLGMKRNLSPLRTEYDCNLIDGEETGINFVSIGVGEGDGAIFKNGDFSYGPPDWVWPRDSIPHQDGTVALIHVYHFLEHLKGEDVISFLQEVQRVLKPGGVLQFCIPYYSSEMAHHDFTHKSFWTEESFSNLFGKKFYDQSGKGHEWKLKVHYQIIAGIVERNLCLLGQLVKE